MVDPREWLVPVTVQGRVIDEYGVEQDGLIWFVPDEPFVRHAGIDYAPISHCVALVNGAFQVQLTRGDIPGQGFTYDIYVDQAHWRAVVKPSADGSAVELNQIVVKQGERS